MAYIRFPIETNPEILVQDVYSYIQTFAPQWKPADGNLDVWIIRALAAKAAENRDLASDVQDDIFRYFGAVLMGIPPVDAVAAIGSTTWTMIDTLGHTVPAGTQLAIPDASGTLWPFYTTASFTVAPGASVTGAGAVSIRALNPGASSSALTGAIQLVDVKDFVLSVALVGPTVGGLDAETDADYLTRLVRKLQRLSQRPILPQDFADAAFDASSEVDRAVALDGYNPIHNLLTANEASAETDASGWIVSGNATIASTGVQAADGTKSVSMTAIAAADMAIASPVANSGAGAKTVSPGDTITGLVSIRAATTVRSCRAYLYWYTATGVLIGNSLGGTAINDSNSAWTNYSVTAVAPATTAFVKVTAYVVAPAAGEVHYIDRASIRRGTGTDWVPGGTVEAGNQKMVTVVPVNAAGNPVSSQGKTDIDTFLQANRELNFVVNVMDPRYTAVDVHADIKVLAGYDPVAIDSDATAALNNYLSPANWGRDITQPHSWVETPKVYYNELIALVSSVPGVDRVVDLTVAFGGSTATRADLTISNPAGLTTPGAISVTVV